MLRDGVRQVGVEIAPADVENWNLGMEVLKPPAQLDAIHDRHVNVGYDQAEVSIHCARGLQRGGTVFRRNHLPAGFRQHPSKESSEQLLIVNQENSAWCHERWPLFGTACRTGRQRIVASGITKICAESTG
jgi:hypothetical protein